MFKPFTADLREPEQARVLVETARPDAVFHLAAQAYVPQAWADPWGTYHTNIRSQLNLLEAISQAEVEFARDCGEFQ